MRADRLVAVVLLLQTHGRMTAADLAQRLETSERTIRRDLESLSIAGLPVVALRGRGGGWELVGRHRTDLSGLSAGEAEALFLVAGPEAVAAGLGIEPKVRSALRKLLAALPEPMRAQAAAARSRVLVDPTRWGAHDDTPDHIAALRDAVLRGVQVDLTYAKRGEPAEVRRVQPFGLVSKAGTWYLIAGTDAGLRTFRASRVHGVAPTDLPVVRPEGFDLEKAWARTREEFPPRQEGVVVEVLVDAEMAPYLARAFGAWTTFELGHDPGGGRLRRLTVRAPSVEAAAWALVRFGEQVEVVGPASVRARMAAIGRGLLSRYGDGPEAPAGP